MPPLWEIVILLLVIINPTAKILVISALGEGQKRKNLLDLTFKSNLVGLFLMVFFAVFGGVFLSLVLHVGVDALKISGGFVLAVIGFEYLWKGELGILKRVKRLDELALAPLGTPMIAGPATLTTVIALSSLGNTQAVVIASFIAIFINTLLMLVTVYYREHVPQQLLHGVIRIIGLFIMAVGVQMGLDGVKNYFM